jgi:RNA polymerase sigma-70 factor (ECF subfamily)
MRPNSGPSHLIDMQARSYPKNQRFHQVLSNEIVRNAQGGDMRAHTQIYQMYSQSVFSLACGFCRNQQCAEDVLHNTFIKLIDKIGLFQNRAPFGMWLRQIAVNESLMHLRKQKKHHSALSTDEHMFLDAGFGSLDDEDDIFERSDFTQAHEAQNEVSGVMSSLPEHVRLVVWLKEVEGYTHEEIAKLVNKSPSYSKTLIARAYKFLRGKIRDGESSMVLKQVQNEH